MQLAVRWTHMHAHMRCSNAQSCMCVSSSTSLATFGHHVLGGGGGRCPWLLPAPAARQATDVACNGTDHWDSESNRTISLDGRLAKRTRGSRRLAHRPV